MGFSNNGVYENNGIYGNILVKKSHRHQFLKGTHRPWAITEDVNPLFRKFVGLYHFIVSTFQYIETLKYIHKGDYRVILNVGQYLIQFYSFKSHPQT